ncbi:MAG: glycoside hydrolase family 2 [Armatimonadetes bacterium]|nr:glycoside hydrolase family 2 [Armatimonadota bacterium]
MRPLNDTETEFPRPEYPRPMLVREDWLNLNGVWEFAFDDADEGLREQWHTLPQLDRRILVPFAYQTELSGIHDKGIHEVVWYARNFDAPEAWRGQDLLLHFGTVDYRATVWVNGEEVGHNQGGHVPFSFDIAPYVKDGANRIVLRVEDRQDRHQPRGKQAASGVAKGCDYYCTTGIWQTVWLEPVPPIRISELRVTPDLEESAFEMRVFLHAPSIGWWLEAEVLDKEEVIARAVEETAGASARLRLTLSDPKPWSPDVPHLYDLRVRLYQDDELLDEVRSYAGLRSVQVKAGKVWLNGAPVYLVMVLDQGYWPDGGMTAPSDEALRADVEWAKRFGFNGARKHQKVEDPRWLYWCDRLGLLVWGEMANARTWSLRAEEIFLAEWERAVRRDYNHPCIITWVPVNESWGAPGLGKGHPGQYAYLERIVALTRRIDPERPVVDNDGWEHTDVSDIVAIHDYTATKADLLERYAETLKTGVLPELSWGKSPLRYFARGSEYRGQPVVLSEVGGLLSLPDAPKEQWDGLYGIYSFCETDEELLEKYGDLMEGIALLHFTVGFCYTQLTDIEQEINGLLTYDRRPKVEPERIAEIHRRLFPGSYR